MGRYQACQDCSKYRPDGYKPRCEIYIDAFPAFDTCQWDDTKRAIITERKRRGPEATA